MLPLQFSKILSAGLALACFCAGCRSGAPGAGAAAPVIHSDAHYAFLFGQRYRTKVDLYLFLFTQQPDYLYVGRNDGATCFGPKELPAGVSPEQIGRVYERWATDGLGDLVIYGVAPAGSILTIHAETHDVTPLSGIRGSGGYPMGFICELNYDGKTNYVFSEFVQSHKTVVGKVPNEDINQAVAGKIP